MRKPTHLSYSSYTLWNRNREEFYLRHLADARPARVPQERPMAVGSAFDAYAKADIHKALGGSDPQYDFDALFVAQVEEHNRDWARDAGRHVFESYKLSGAYDDLLDMLRQSSDPVRLEFKVARTIEGVPLVGRPDLQFAWHDLLVILDWKVKGYCSAASPSKHYLLCRDGWLGNDAKPSRSHNTQHKMFLPTEAQGLRIHAGWLESEYMAQLSIYAWLVGLPVGTDRIIFWIEELCAARHEPKPLIRAATHRAWGSPNLQRELIQGIKRAWSQIESGHIFEELPREESDALCQVLEQQARSLAEPESEFSVVNRIVPCFSSTKGSCGEFSCAN